MRTLFALSVLVTLMGVKLVHAEFINGEQLLGLCESKDRADQSYCLGYITAAADAHVMERFMLKLSPCIPIETSNLVIKETVIKYLREHAALRVGVGSTAVSLAITFAFCP